jgi:PAS domain S-box-containing protein
MQRSAETLADDHAVAATEIARLRAELAAEQAARRAVEAQLDAVAQQQQILLGTTPYLSWFKDVAGRYVFCSDTFLEFLKLRRDQVIGRTAAEVFPADYAAEVEANDRQAMQTGKTLSIAGYVHSGNRLRWIETQKAPVYDAEGRLLGVLGTSIDVTARQTTEELLARHARCAEGLARCSQALLRDRIHAAPPSTALTAALNHLRGAVDADCAVIYTCPPPTSDPSLIATVQVQAADADPTAAYAQRLALPERVRVALEARCSWGGAAPKAAPQGDTPPTLLLLPLHVDGAWWGCLGLYRRPDALAWHPQELQALEVAAEMIGAFLHSRARADELRRRIAELTTLNRIVQTVTSWTHLGRSLKNIGLLVRDLFDAQAISFWLHDEANTNLQRAVYVGRTRTSVDTRSLAVSASAVAQHALAQNAAVTIDNVPADPLLADVDGPPGAAALVTPLQCWGDNLGLLIIHAGNEQPFTPADIALAETIAGTLASALFNTRLFAVEQRQRRLAESLRQVALDLSGSLDLKAVTSAIFTQLQRVLPCESAAVLLADGTTLSVMAGIGSAAAAIGQPIPLDSTDRIVAAYHTRRPQIESLAPPEQSRPMHNAMPELPWRSRTGTAGPGRWIGVPLVRGQTTLGVLAVDYSVAASANDEVISTLEAFAGHVAIAIDNAQRYHAASELAAARERQHLARELHDSVSQSLYFANLAAETLPVIWELDPDEGRQRLEELQRFTNSAQAEMRTLLFELRPGMLVDMPLHDALGRLIAVLTAKMAAVELEIHLGLTPPLPPDVQIALYRIAQEALRNVMQHARAERVGLQLELRPAYILGRPWQGALTLTLADNGRGFDPAAIPPGRLGLTSLAERAAGIGADLQITSAPGAGTQVRVVWTGKSAR